ncbi:hypothetical protein HAV21_03440 [Paenarthrobacter sp. MSM-2-10-13]|uniref:hypothetical protein n=1 Tax=Paenarthrobacter sp. MSM-2-10-13 TaxID=2717318 RepID=UPI0014208B35|nr:hypothetical protein [Paenarthrobacter sp. MSM-2-10-13]NHW45951.1 hypothetical protein [Paenarthrobacter sp. MSM-2-10-13]
MGTNYYARINTCPTCHRPEEEIHLGKSSYGWQFLFAYNDGDYYKDITELKGWLNGKQIFNEYDEPVTQDDFWKMIESKQVAVDPEQGHFMVIDGYKFMNGQFS